MPSTPPPTSRSKRSPYDLAALLSELATSGQSAAAFARARGVPVWQLYHARRVAQRSRARRSSSLVPVRVVDAPPSPPSPLELRLPSGLRLFITPDFDETTLRRLLGIVASC